MSKYTERDMSMAKEKLKMDSAQIAQIMGTVGSPLIVISELLKNAVDASAENIDIYYDFDSRSITVENDYKGFTFEEIQNLSRPGISAKKKGKNLTNERGMFLTGSKGLGLLSVFLLCDKAEIFTSPSDHSVHKITFDKKTGAIESLTLKQNSPKEYTKVILRDVSKEIISFLSSEAEVRKLRHICTSLYKGGDVPFPQMQLHIINEQVDSRHNINFTCDFPPMLYDVTFGYSKKTNVLRFCCNSTNKQITSDEITLTDFALADLQKIMLEKYGIKETIPTRTNDLFLSDFSSVPTFEGQILVYEKSLAGAQLKTYGAGVNVYVNEFALYNYLAEENDWLGLADYSQRKKVTRLKPHNVFGYLDEIDAQVRRYTRAATQKVENLTNRDQNVRGNLNVLLTALSRNRRAGDLVDRIQPVFQLYEQSFLSEKSLWYRKRPEKRTRAATVLIQETASDADAAAQAAQLLRSEYGRAAIAAYVQGWLGDADVRYSKDLNIKDDKSYIMSLLAVLTSGDSAAGYQIKELGGSFHENGYSIPQMQIRRKEKKNGF